MKVLVADDHEVVRRGLNELLRDEYPDVHIGEASSGREIIARLAENTWDLILLDIMMPETNIIDTLKRIREFDTNVPVLILTAGSETEYAVRTLRSGANGYITKQHASDKLIEAIQKVLAGETYLSSEAVQALAEELRQDASASPHETLSRRELQVFCLIARGKGVKEVAFDLSVSAKTVATYISRIREKTGLTNYVDIARYAIRHKLVD